MMVCIPVVAKLPESAPSQFPRPLYFLQTLKAHVCKNVFGSFKQNISGDCMIILVADATTNLTRFIDKWETEIVDCGTTQITIEHFTKREAW